MLEYDIAPSVFAGFIDESKESLELVETLFVDLEKNPGKMEIIQEIFRPIHSLKGTCAFFGLLHTKELSHTMENVLDDVRQGKTVVTDPMISLLLEGVDMLKGIFNRLSGNEDEIVDEAGFRKLVNAFSAPFDEKKPAELKFEAESVLMMFDRIEEIRTLLPRELSGLCDEVQAVLETIFGKKDTIAHEQKRPDEKSADKEKKEEKIKSADHPDRKIEKTMRVPEKSIDMFIDYLGELVIVEEMFLCLQKKVAGMIQNQKVSADFKRVIETFSSLSDNLIKNILEIRSVEAGMLLNKATRIVRDICTGTSKKALVRIEGEKIRIDKSYVELLDAPLTHLVRNAIDHGIEESDMRMEIGKPESGDILISMQESGDDIKLVIQEDGKGLDYDAIYEKAVGNGVIAKGQMLSEEEIGLLIFQSGVSTAKTVTDVSGRGVGMDVVKKAIDSAGGTIQIQSKKGEGSVFTISLPKNVTTQIINGFLVRSGQSIYVFPMDIIGETFAPEEKDFSTLINQARVVARRDRLFPVIDLGRALSRQGLAGKGDKPANTGKNVAMIISAGSKEYAFCVDELLGIQKVVVKPVHGMGMDKTLFDGAAMMGDDTVAMILGHSGLEALVREG